jgi:cytochrome c
VASLLPEFARNNHGNLAEQQRGVGPQRGADTTQPVGAMMGARVVASSAAPAPVGKPAATATPQAPGAKSPAAVTAAKSGAQALALAQKYTCTACHGTDNKIIGPSFKDIAAKHAKRADAQAYLAGKIRAGGQGVWGPIPMPAQTLPDADLQMIATWLASGAPK